jgi:DNA-binding MarR family transcriptional regulator
VATFRLLSNHGLVLLSIAQDPRARIRDIAAGVGITERAAQRIVADLVAAQYLTRERDGRRNRYTLRTDLSITFLSQRDVDLGSLLHVLVPREATDAPGEPDDRARVTA